MMSQSHSGVVMSNYNPDPSAKYFPPTTNSTPLTAPSSMSRLDELKLRRTSILNELSC